MPNYAPSRSPYSTRSGFLITELMFRDIQRFIRSNEQSIRRLKQGEDMLIQLLARAGHARAQKRSAGPVDYRQENPGAAWRIPVRRITGEYYLGWKVKRIVQGVWYLYNDSREAYFIEYGIHTSGRRVRRPVLKLTIQDVVKLANRVAPQFTNWVFNPGLGVQSPPVMWSL